MSENIIKKSLRKFSGVQRRMTKIFSKNKNDFYDDYAHHPTEIKSILEGVKEIDGWRNWYTLHTRTTIGVLYKEDIITYGYSY